MTEKVWIRGVFDKKVLFTRGALFGVVYGLVMFIIAGLLLPPMLGLTNTAYTITLGIMTLLVVPLSMGSALSKQEHELWITDTKITHRVGTSVMEFPLDSITSYDIANGVLKVQAPPRKFTVVGLVNHEEIAQFLNWYFNGKAARAAAARPAQAPAYSSADELKKYKELLDMGAITQEEFDAKKKQLLGL